MELAHANRVAAMGQLSVSIAHEVNQPVASVITNANAALRWLGAAPPDLEEVRLALGRIVKEGGRASEVFGRIRSFLKKAPLQTGALEINDAVREVVALTRAEAAKNGISVQTHFVDGLPPVQGDRVQLQQVTLNLIINAVEAMSELSAGPRELLIRTDKTEADTVRVQVQDSGPGLPPARIEQVFDPFYTTKSAGLGVGLSICRSIIEAHDGRLWKTAREPRGTIFNFTLPAHPAEPAHQTPALA